MTLFLIISAFVLCFMFGTWNGMVLSWNDATTAEDKKKTGTRWHGFGFIIRLAILALFIPCYNSLPLISLAFYLSLYIFIAWVLYDGSCNLWRSALPGNIFQRFFYSGNSKSGTTSIIDKLMGDYLPFIKVGYTVVVIFFTLYFLFA